MTEWWIWGGMAACLLVVGRCAARQNHPFRALLAGAVCGLGALAILAVLEPVTGVALPLNHFTVFTAAVLGVPGVTAVLILQLLL